MSSSLVQSIDEAIAVAAGLRSACLLEGAADGAAVASAAACAAARAQLPSASQPARGLVLLSLSGGEFIVHAARLAARCASLAAGAPLPPLVQAAAAPGGVSASWLLRGAEAAAQAAALREAMAAVARAVARTMASGEGEGGGSGGRESSGGVSGAAGDGGAGGAWRDARSRTASRGTRSSGCTSAAPLLRARAALPAGACPVAAAGWLLEYPLLYVTGGAAATCLGGEPLLICSVVYALPAPRRLCTTCSPAGTHDVAQPYTRRSRLAFSAPLSRCEAGDGGNGGGGSDGAGHFTAMSPLPPSTPPGLRAFITEWEARVVEEASAWRANLNAADAARFPPPTFEYAVEERACVSL